MESTLISTKIHKHNKVWQPFDYFALTKSTFVLLSETDKLTKYYLEKWQSVKSVLPTLYRKKIGQKLKEKINSEHFKSCLKFMELMRDANAFVFTYLIAKERYACRIKCHARLFCFEKIYIWFL